MSLHWAAPFREAVCEAGPESRAQLERILDSFTPHELKLMVERRQLLVAMLLMLWRKLLCFLAYRAV